MILSRADHRFLAWYQEWRGVFANELQARRAFDDATEFRLECPTCNKPFTADGDGRCSGCGGSGAPIDGQSAAKLQEKSDKLACAMGWKRRWQNRGGGPLHEAEPEGSRWKVWVPPDDHTWESLDRPVPPDYTTNLSALQDVWDSLNFDQQAKFAYWLAVVIFAGPRLPTFDREHDLARLANATAEQRLEALGITLGLWEYDCRIHQTSSAS